MNDSRIIAAKAPLGVTLEQAKTYYCCRGGRF